LLDAVELDSPDEPDEEDDDPPDDAPAEADSVDADDDVPLEPLLSLLVLPELELDFDPLRLSVL
jgi:hypothetical protein